MNTVLLNQMLQLFMIMGVGYVLFKLKYIDIPFSQKLTKLLLDITLPFMILSSVMSGNADKDFSKIGIVFVVSFSMYVFLTVLSILVAKVFRFPPKEQGMYMFMHMFSNTAFMGFPVINALFGNEAMIYTAILNIFFNLFSFTVGIVMVNYDASVKKKGTSFSGMFDLKNLLTPGTIGSLAAVVIYFIPVEFPSVIRGVFSSVGGLTSTLAMLLIGSTLAKMPVNIIFNDWRVYLFTAVKQVIIPVLVWPLMKLLIDDTLIRSVMFILFLMPVGNTAVLFASRYQKNEELAAKTVFVTTLASILTIPFCLNVLKVI